MSILKYDELKDAIDRALSEREDYLDSVFMPLVFSLNYRPSYNPDLKVGDFKMNHARGTITARPDEDSLIIFYRNQSDSNEADWDNDNEIHIYLDSGKMIVDLPRFGAISRQSEILFNGKDDDRKMYEGVLPLIDYRQRTEAYNNSNGIRYMDYLQFCDDVNAAVGNGEHLRVIQQILNDAFLAENGDDDLINFIVTKIKKRFDPLDDKKTEDGIRELVRSDFVRRIKEKDEFIIIPRQEQLAAKERKKQEIKKSGKSGNMLKSGNGMSIDGIFQQALKKVEKDNGEQPKTQPEQETATNDKPAEKKISKPFKTINKGGAKDGENADVSADGEYGNTGENFF